MATIEKEVSQKKDERQMKRDARKAGREAKRDTAAGDIISKESGRYGIDLDDLTASPVGDAAKTRITEGVSQAVEAEKWDGAKKIAGFQKAYSGPSLEDRPSLDAKALKESARKQRKSAWVDMLTAFGQGVRSGRVDPESLRSTKFKRERDVEFQQYRDITERNKKTKNLWEHQNRQDLLEFVNKQIADKNISDAEKKKYEDAAAQIKTKNAQWEKEFGLKQEQLKARKEGKYYAPRSTGARGTASKTRYTDKYYEISGNSPAVINELAKITGGYAVDDDGNLKNTLRPAEAERLSNTLVTRMFKEDPETGEFIPIPGMENYIDDLSNSIDASKAKQSEISALEAEQYEKTKDANRWQKPKINAAYITRINQAEAELEQMQLDTRSLMEGNIPETSSLGNAQELIDRLNEIEGNKGEHLRQIDKNGMAYAQGAAFDMKTPEGRKDFEEVLLGTIEYHSQEKLDEFFK